jgi:glycosyltransferase involved in cell wall biosynthesis
MKLSCVMSSPIDTFSGYGGRARDFAKSLLKIKGEEWDIKFLPQRWGNCPFGALNENDPEEKEIIDRIILGLNSQPDIWIQHTVANEFQAVGRFNIGISALVETSIVPNDMLEGLNRMNLNIVSSEFSKKIASDTAFEKYDKNSNQKVGDLVLEKPIEVLFEGVNTKIFKRLEKSEFDLSEIKEEFCFLSVAHWLPGELGEDRKQLTTLIKTFLETFRDKKRKPGFILKTGLAGYSIIEEEKILDMIDSIRKNINGDLPNIYFLHGELTPEEMNELYNHPKVKAFALVGNEGFGRPYLEFSAASSKPIIASPWSGHIDFLQQEYNIFVEGALAPVHPSAANQFLLKEAVWFKANPYSVSKCLIEVYENYSKFVDNGKRQGHTSRSKFSLDKMSEKLKEILDKNVPKISKPVSIQLPKLANVHRPENQFLEEIKEVK